MELVPSSIHLRFAGGPACKAAENSYAVFPRRHRRNLDACSHAEICKEGYRDNMTRSPEGAKCPPQVPDFANAKYYGTYTSLFFSVGKTHSWGLPLKQSNERPRW